MIYVKYLRFASRKISYQYSTDGPRKGAMFLKSLGLSTNPKTNNYLRFFQSPLLPLFPLISTFSLLLKLPLHAPPPQFSTIYLAMGWAETYSTASDTLPILSASASGISIANSSSIAITTSTASRESRPRSSPNLDVGWTFAGSILSKFLITVMIRSCTSAGGRKVVAPKHRRC